MKYAVASLGHLLINSFNKYVLSTYYCQACFLALDIQIVTYYFIGINWHFPFGCNFYQTTSLKSVHIICSNNTISENIAQRCYLKVKRQSDPCISEACYQNTPIPAARTDKVSFQNLKQAYNRSNQIRVVRPYSREKKVNADGSQERE